MHPTRVMIATALLLCSVVLASCASGGGPAKPSVSSEPSGAELAELVDVDTSAVPTGPSVGELISADDFTDILGRDDLTFAPAL